MVTQEKWKQALKGALVYVSRVLTANIIITINPIFLEMEIFLLFR